MRRPHEAPRPGLPLALTAACLLPLACGRPPAPVCGLGGSAAIAGLNATIAYSCDLEPRGRRLNRDLFALTTGGRPARRLTWGFAQDSDPAWSPDGSRIAFQSTRDGVLNVYTMDSGGGSVFRLTRSLAEEFEPAWSPDGSSILFASGRGGARAPLGPRGLPASIYSVAPDGRGVTRLTHSSSYDGDPVWSPDGSRVAFVSDRSGSANVWVMNADGGGLTRLTTWDGTDDRPMWSPDGSRLLFGHGQSDDDNGPSSIWVMNADGSGLRQLIRGDGREPSWSPDGHWIAFVSDRGGGLDLYVARSDGSLVTRLTTDRAPKQRPAWRP